MCKDEVDFKKTQSDGIWIYKPSNLNCGRGIYLVEDFQVKSLIFSISKIYFSKKN